MIIAMRKCWRPKREELAEQCVSCPFREGNDAEWRVMVAKLRTKLGIRGPVTQAALDHGRAEAKRDLRFSGDFICHFTAYDADANRRPLEEARQCPGASAFYRSGEQA